MQDLKRKSETPIHLQTRALAYNLLDQAISITYNTDPTFAKSRFNIQLTLYTDDRMQY